MTSAEWACNNLGMGWDGIEDARSFIAFSRCVIPKFLLKFRYFTLLICLVSREH